MTTPSGSTPPSETVERMVATFEAEASPIPRDGDDERAVDYAIRITRVRDAVLLTDRAALAASAGLEVADTFATVVTGTVESPITLKRVEILQGFDFDVEQLRVTGTLLFDRITPIVAAVEAVVAEPVVPETATLTDTVTTPARVFDEGRVSVLAGEGVQQFHQALLSWTNATIDLDAHGFHFQRGGESSHVWHGHRPLGPVFWHYGSSTPDALDERLAITSAPVDGLILYVVHSPVDTTITPVRAIAESAARVVLQLPNVRQSMHFEAPDRDGNLWIPFAILDGRLITTDVVGTVAGTPDEATFRGLLGDLFATLPLPVVDVVPPPVADVPIESLWTAQRPALGLGALAIALTLLVSMLRGAGRGAIMAIVSLVVVALVVQARARLRR